jgi:hypothetical protein
MKNQTIINNFLSTMDTDLPMVDNFRNALNDAFVYRWSGQTLIEIMKGIEEAYKVSR